MTMDNSIYRFIMEETVFQNHIVDYILFLFIFIVGLFLIRIFRVIMLRRLRLWAEKSATKIDDFLIKIFQKNLVPLLYFGVFYLAIKSLTLNPSLNTLIDVSGVILLTVFGIRFLIAITIYSLEMYWVRKEEDATRIQSSKAIIPIVKVIIWGSGIAFLLDNLGFKVSTVVAGLGIGGVAVALAAQAVLKDLFSYVAIFFDRPFELGDFIIVGDYMGAVEHIGIKTTRIRSLSGEQLVFSNADLTDSRIRNYKRMERRRVNFKIGVTYQTDISHLKDIPDIVRRAIESIDNTTFDRAHFASYGDFSLVFDIVYYVAGSDYNVYMDIHQRINLIINEEFTKRGIEFAYPTQTLYVNNPEGRQ